MARDRDRPENYSLKYGNGFFLGCYRLVEDSSHHLHHHHHQPLLFAGFNFAFYFFCHIWLVCVCVCLFMALKPVTNYIIVPFPLLLPLRIFGPMSKIREYYWENSTRKGCTSWPGVFQLVNDICDIYGIYMPYIHEYMLHMRYISYILYIHVYSCPFDYYWHCSIQDYWSVCSDES